MIFFSRLGLHRFIVKQERKARWVVIGNPPFKINSFTTKSDRSPDSTKAYNENRTYTAIQRQVTTSLLLSLPNTGQIGELFLPNPVHIA